MSVLPINSGEYDLTSTEGIALYSGTNPAPVKDRQFRQGWYYEKVSASQQFVYTFSPEGTHPIQQGELENVFFVGAVDTYSGLDDVPYVAVETKPLGDGNDASPGNYRSRYEYKLSATTSGKKLILNELTHFTIKENPTPSFPYQTLHLNNITVAPGSPAATTEEVKNIKIELSTSSAVTAKVLVSYVGWKEHNRTDINPNILLSALSENKELDDIADILQDPTRQVTRLVGSNDINGGTPHRYLTVEANGRLLTIPHMPTTNSRLLDLVNKTPDKLSFSNSHSLTVPGSGSVSTTAIDLGENTTPITIQLAGTTTVNNIDVVVQVSNDDVTYYNYGHPMISVSGGEIYAQFDLTFRYYKLEVTDNSGAPATVLLIESGKSL